MHQASQRKRDVPACRSCVGCGHHDVAGVGAIRSQERVHDLRYRDRRSALRGADGEFTCRRLIRPQRSLERPCRERGDEANASAPNVIVVGARHGSRVEWVSRSGDPPPSRRGRVPQAAASLPYSPFGSITQPRRPSARPPQEGLHQRALG